MDLDDLDAPKRAPSRLSRFAPKGSKIKPKTEPAVSSEPPSHQSVESDLKKEEFDSKTSLPVNLVAAAKAKNETPVSHDLVSMDVDAKPEEQPKDEDMELNQNGEDEVVREIDVYFNPSMDPNTKLYVFQCPLRPLWRPYAFDESCEEVRVKTGSLEVEVDLALDVDSMNYDQDADPQILITKQTLTSSSMPPIATGYAVGVLVGNKLHLNPVHAVVQLRPSFRQSRCEGSRKKNDSTTSNLEGSMKEEDLKEEKPIVSAKKQNKPSASNEQIKDTGEKWIPLKYHGATSDASARYLQKMVEPDESPIQFSMSRDDYLNTLCPGTLIDSNGSNYPSRRILLSLPLEERFKTLLLKGPPIHRFDALKNFAPEASVEDTLGVLCRHARLVQGLWVPKSSLLYGQGIEVLAREYVLLLFSKDPIIRDSELPRHPQLLKAVRDALSTLAIYRLTLSDWKFKEPPDVSFIKLYPNIVNKEEQAWADREKPIRDSIFRGRDKPTLKNSANDPGTLKSSIKQTSKSSNGGQSRMPMSDETRQALPKILNKIFKDHKVCSFQQICQRLREMAVSKTSHPKGDAKEVLAAAKGVDAPMEELQAVIGQVAINIHGVYVPKSSPDHPDCNDFRKVVIDLFLAEGPNAKLKKASIVEAAKLQLKVDDIPQAVYQKVLSEICVSTKGSCWVLKTGDGNSR